MARGDIELSIDADASGAIKGFKQTETAAQRAANVVNKGAKYAAIGFAAAGAAAVVMAKNAGEDAAAARRLGIALKNTSGATNAQVSSMEKWISKQGLAFGISDDQLRPAIQKLAQATGSLTKAQELASLAMNISAGTGKSLDTVTQALVRAQNGNVAAVGKLGLATKDASGHTKTFEQLQVDLARTFKGQANAAASSTEGKMARFKVAIDEAQESIGYLLLPALSAVATVMVTNVIPAVSKIADRLSENKPVVIAIGAAIGAFGAAFIIASVAMKVYSAGATIVSAVTKTWTGIQWALNASVMGFPLVWIVAAIAAVIAAAILIVKNWDKIKAALAVAWEAIKAAFAASWNAIKKAAGVVWDAIKSTISKGLDFLKNLFLNFTGPGLLIKHWDKIKSAGAAAFDGVKNAARSAFNGIASLWNSTVGKLSFKVPGWVPVVGGKGFDVPDIPMLAKGGIVTRPTLAMIGEAGPEAVVPLSGPDAQKHLGGKGLTIENLTINAAPNEPIHSSLPRAIGMLDLLYGAA